MTTTIDGREQGLVSPAQPSNNEPINGGLAGKAEPEVELVVQIALKTPRFRVHLSPTDVDKQRESRVRHLKLLSLPGFQPASEPRLSS